jgi:hypothetical protein
MYRGLLLKFTKNNIDDLIIIIIIGVAGGPYRSMTNMYRTMSKGLLPPFLIIITFHVCSRSRIHQKVQIQDISKNTFEQFNFKYSYIFNRFSTLIFYIDQVMLLIRITLLLEKTYEIVSVYRNLYFI